MKVRQELSQYFNGYKGQGTTNISPSESIDVKESVCDKASYIRVQADIFLAWMEVLSAI